MKIFSLENKTAIVTGALGLLGKEHCKALYEAGANVVVTDLDEQECIKFADSLGINSIGCKLDVTDSENIKHVKKTVLNKFERIDILVNNAAINDMFENPKAALELSKFENYPLELWQKSIDVNLTGVFLCSQIFGTLMAKQKSGSIINIASTYGITAPDQSLYKNEKEEQTFFKPPAYSATKGAVIMFTKYLASYWGKEGVRVNSLSPGGIENNQDEFFIQKYSSKTPLGRMAQPTDYKGALIFLASDASSYMTGANLVVDGGWTCW
ncbi:MAG: SDR family oxidoreductase [Ignavibacteria bacterium]|nr:SDR family oxidoreductase [Ignavibacteria bacterium]